MKLKTQFEFDSAHRLVGYEGKCSNLHGHIWRVELEIEGEWVDDIGIMWDFTNVKTLKEMFDHKTILKRCDEHKGLGLSIVSLCGKDSLYIMDENPTAENICKEILKILKEKDGSLKYTIRVFESPKSSCEVSG